MSEGLESARWPGLFTWGGGRSSAASTPTPLKLNSTVVVGAACGEEQVAVWTTNGSVFTWKSDAANTAGEASQGTWLPSLPPAAAGSGRAAKKVACSDGLVLTVSNTGTLYAWGAERHTPMPPPLPQELSEEENGVVEHVSLYKSRAAICAKGALWVTRFPPEKSQICWRQVPIACIVCS